MLSAVVAVGILTGTLKAADGPVSSGLPQGYNLVYEQTFDQPAALQDFVVGFGSFDDTGMVDNIRLWAPNVETRRIDCFSPPLKRLRLDAGASSNAK